MDKVICVYSSSSCILDKIYFEATEKLGEQIALRKDVLLYGGGYTGLMGAIAQSVHSGGGKVIGVIPEKLNQVGIVYPYCDELIVTSGMRERKGIMDSRADAFIALAGGFGTLEELLEIITLKQLVYHNKPIVILNTNEFYKPMFEQFELIIKEKFAKPECSELYFITDNVTDAFKLYRFISTTCFSGKMAY